MLVTFLNMYGVDSRCCRIVNIQYGCRRNVTTVRVCVRRLLIYLAKPHTAKGVGKGVGLSLRAVKLNLSVCCVYDGGGGGGITLHDI